MCSICSGYTPNREDQSRGDSRGSPEYADRVGAHGCPPLRPVNRDDHPRKPGGRLPAVAWSGRPAENEPGHIALITDMHAL